MIWKEASLVLCFALCVLSVKRPAISEQKLVRYYGHHGDLSHVGHHEPEHHEVYAWAYPSYEFSYYVHDPHTHDQKGQHEERDGDKVTGDYWLVQPDGRKRTVKYRSDHKSGFQAEVNYSPHEGHHPKVKDIKEKQEYKEDVNEHHGNNDKKVYDEHNKDLWELTHGRGLGRDERRNDKYDSGRDGRRDEEHDERRGEDNKKRGNKSKEGYRREGNKHENRDHHEDRGHEGRLSGIHGWGKKLDEHKELRHEARKLEGRKSPEEHWRHGVLVGWTEGKGREDHSGGDEKPGRENDHEDHEDRRDQRAFNPKFKPLLPYGHRLH